MKSAYAILAQDCESSDYIARHAKIKPAKPDMQIKPAKPDMQINLAHGQTMIIAFNRSAERALDAYEVERDEALLYEPLLPRNMKGHEVLNLSSICSAAC